MTQWDFQNKGKSGWTGTSSFVFTVPAFTGSIFVCGPLHHNVLLLFFGAVGLFRSDMLLIFYMVWP